jgi:hypothetical protein
LKSLSLRLLLRNTCGVHAAWLESRFPGFPVELGGFGNFMRLSLLKGARAASSCAA